VEADVCVLKEFPFQFSVSFLGTYRVCVIPLAMLKRREVGEKKIAEVKGNEI
jgi:hypothetical protein